MRIAILGATSQIAKDLVLSFGAQDEHDLTLFARRPERVTQWLASSGLPGRYAAADFGAFGADRDFDAILNFVGVGDPARMALMGASILDVTLQYDDLALDYLRQHANCRYLFLSSGAAYGASFDEPAAHDTKALVPINNLQPHDWYAVAKLYAECRHRALPELAIIDIRVFNYFSRTQDMAARFLICDIVRAIRDQSVLKTAPGYIVRDYLHPADFYRLVSSLLLAPAANAVLDCYSRAPIDKPGLLGAMQERFGLRYEIAPACAGVNATGSKPHYYSLNPRAADFGYRPAFTSLEGIVQEIDAILPAPARGGA
jgi:nucleoside-diphosphate-sugar epimerase